MSLGHIAGGLGQSQLNRRPTTETNLPPLSTWFAVNNVIATPTTSTKTQNTTQKLTSTSSKPTTTTTTTLSTAYLSTTTTTTATEATATTNAETTTTAGATLVTTTDDAASTTQIDITTEGLAFTNQPTFGYTDLRYFLTTVFVLFS